LRLQRPTRNTLGCVRRKELRIKITLIHNPKAGDRSRPSDDDLVRLIRKAGHKVKYQSCKEKKWKKALKKPCDIIAVAGGDGTVGKVARELIEKRIPIAILPLGTANNIANSLGIADISLQDLIASWNTARSINFDSGLAKGPWGTENFIEGFGVGLFAETMLELDESGGIELRSEKPEKVIPAVMKILNDQVDHFPAQNMAVHLDGKDVSGDYVMLEALNIRYIGPNLDLVSAAQMNDGFFDVVFVTRRDRSKLRKHISDRLAGKKTRGTLTVRRGQHLQIEWENSPIHIDDMTWPTEKDRTPLKSNAIDIRIDPAALVFLAPEEQKEATPTSNKKIKKSRRG
jgi:diacylglycerol kinase family enzyme